MATTIKIKNEAGKKVDVELDDKSEKKTVSADKTIELEEKYLKSASFHRFVEAGDLRFVLSDTYDDKQLGLARRTLELLINRSGRRFVELHQRALGSKKTMLALRDNYNRSWQAAEQTLKKAKEKEIPTDFLSDAVNHFLNVNPEKKTVAELEAEIKKLEKEDLAATGRTLPEWYKERQEKEAALEHAKKVLASAEQALITRYGSLLKHLREAADGLKELDPAKEIGQKIKTNW